MHTSGGKKRNMHILMWTIYVGRDCEIASRQGGDTAGCGRGSERGAKEQPECVHAAWCSGGLCDGSC